MIVSDNGSEFTGNAILGWTDQARVELHYCPWQADAKRLHRELQRPPAVTNCSMRRATCLRSSVFRLLRVTFLVTTARMPELLGGYPWTSLRQRENAGHIPLQAWLYTIYSIKSIGSISVNAAELEVLFNILKDIMIICSFLFLDTGSQNT